MRRGAANGSRDGGAQAAEALNKLRDMQQRLERNQSGRGERDIQRALRQAEELAKDQKGIPSDVNALDQGQGGEGRQARAQQLAQRKDAMDTKVGDLQQQLEKLANETRRDQREASRRLDDAAGSIRDKKIREMIRYSKSALNGNATQYARGMEETIGSNLDALQKKIGDAAAAMGKASQQDTLARAADKTRDLVRGIESLDQRMRERSQNGRNQNGQRSQNGQQASNGQDSKQGAQGSRGSQGSQSAQGSQGSQASQGSEGSQGSQGAEG